MKRAAGMTIVELVTVLIIVGVIAVTAVSAFNKSAYDTVAAADRIRAIASYAQKTATAARRAVKIAITGGTLSLQICRVATSTSALCPGADYTDLALPNGEASYTPSGTIVLSASATIYLDAVGRPADTNGDALETTAPTISVTGDGTTTVTVNLQSGYARY